MTQHSFFEKQLYHTDDTSNIVKHLKDIGTFDDVTHEYIKGLASFLDEYSLDDCKDEDKLALISYNYWYILFLYEKHKDNKKNWALSTFSKYFTAATRLMEFSIYILHVHKHIDFFLELPAGDKILFYHYKNIESKIKVIHFDVSKEETNKVMVTGVGYKSTVHIVPPRHDKDIDFNFYLKLDDKYVNNIYELRESKNMIDGRNPSGGHWERTTIQSYDEYQDKLLGLYGCEVLTKIDEVSYEDIMEKNNRQTRVLSVQLDQDNSFGLDEMVDINKLDKVKLNSTYKRYLINKAIGRAISKKNMALRSTYTIPEMEVLVHFMKGCVIEEALESNLILLTLVSGIDTKKLIYAMMGFDTEIIFKSTKSILQIRNKDIFAKNYDIDDGIAMNTQGKFVEIYLPESIVRVWQETKRFIRERFHLRLLQACKTFEKDVSADEIICTYIEGLDTKESVSDAFRNLLGKLESEDENKFDITGLPKSLCEEILEEGKAFFKQKKKKYNKKIVLKYRTIPSLFLHLFKITQEESDISMLFSGVMQKNDEARVCYGASPIRLVSYEFWQLKLIKIFGLDDVLYGKYKIQTQRNPNGIVYKQNWIGSKIYLNGAKFKIFLQRILSLNVESKLDRLNLRMIFLQYALSCLMATRHHAQSLSMEQYSKREKIICIQEKGKNLYSGKRIIPLTDLGAELANLYLSLREAYGLHHFSPSLIFRDEEGDIEKLMRKGNISDWFISKMTDNNRDDIEEILKYTQHIPLNFGRHIFTSFALQSSTLSASYLDAFLGHFKMGNEDQGIYSYFDNQAYMYEIKQQVEAIAHIYIPKDWRRQW